MATTLLAFLLATGALAAPAAPAKGKRPSACSEDIKLHCKGADPKDRQALLACLASHEAGLSPSCLKTYRSWKARSSQPASPPARKPLPCDLDIQRLCKGIKDSSEVTRCVERNKEKLSEACVAERADTRRLIDAMKQACAAEFSGVCKGQRTPCLGKHLSELSSACKAAFEARMASQPEAAGTSPGNR